MKINEGDILIEYINGAYYYVILYAVKRLRDNDEAVVDYIVKNEFGPTSDSLYLTIEANKTIPLKDILSSEVQKMDAAEFSTFKQENIHDMFRIKNVLLKHR